jgi:uncharacterized protein (TIGR01777 family)
MVSKKIVIAGGTGNIGKLLSKTFAESGYEVIILSRQRMNSMNPKIKYILWDGEAIGSWVDELEDVDTLINLSGKSIQCRFTEENKKELFHSRLKPTQILGEAIEKLNSPPRLWINFSGISVFEGVVGYHDEESKDYGNTFLAKLTEQWEQTFVQSNTPKTHKVILRLSPVLSKKFGMYKELYPLAKFGLGGQVADGEQYVSWIHELDLIRMVVWIIDRESPSTLYHACVPEPISNKEFMKNLRRSVGMPIGMPLPTLFAKMGAYFKGVESDMLLLTNSVYATQPSKEGFNYNYSTTSVAFEHLTKK